MPLIHPDFLLESYRYPLPEERIAQQPAARRDASRLMLLGRSDGAARCASFADILDFLPPGALLVANNSRVIPARLEALRPGSGKSEVLLLTPLPLLQAHSDPEGGCTAEAEILLRPAKKSRPGDELRLADGLSVTVLEHGPFGRCRARLCWQGDLRRILERTGAMPLPPYIKRGAGTRETENLDRERYQTSYADSSKAGSVAAPTAGLHFTPELLRALKDSGREWAELTLYVGYGTFSPVRCEDIREHPMHAEYVEISNECARAVSRAKAEGRPVIAVGTTSARSLEGAFALQHAATADMQDAKGRDVHATERAGNTTGNSREATQQPEAAPEKADVVSDVKSEALDAFAGWIDIFLYPGKSFQVVDGLITNFHLPESSLLMLVSALAGRQNTLAAYQKALDENFRFFSYGDAMLIL